jgi:hypothetical protein
MTVRSINLEKKSQKLQNWCYLHKNIHDKYTK